MISTKVPGYIIEVAVEDNQSVHSGDILARLDDRDYRAALVRAEGEVAAQQALLANLDATTQLQKAVINQARAGGAASAAEIARARDDQVRYRDLASRSAVSIQNLQKAEADYKQALANGEKADATLTAARRALSQIVINLTNNAIKFTESGSVHLSLSVAENDGRRQLRISITDTGPGIRADEMNTLFEAFIQGQASRRQGVEGTGLGLHLSRKLASLLGGEIHCQSEFGKGSTFTLVLTES